jgi:hypothetical protein
MISLYCYGPAMRTMCIQALTCCNHPSAAPSPLLPLPNAMNDLHLTAGLPTSGIFHHHSAQSPISGTPRCTTRTLLQTIQPAGLPHLRSCKPAIAKSAGSKQQRCISAALEAQASAQRQPWHPTGASKLQAGTKSTEHRGPAWGELVTSRWDARHSAMNYHLEPLNARPLH